MENRTDYINVPLNWPRSDPKGACTWWETCSSLPVNAFDLIMMQWSISGAPNGSVTPQALHPSKRGRGQPEGALPTPVQDLPTTVRDHINQFVLDLKFRWVPFRGNYRFRSYKYMKWIDPETGLLRFVVDPKRISLDVGANHGLFTHFLARYSPHVHAFEPPLPFNVLKRVVDRNVTVHHMALTDRTSDVELVVPRGRKGWTNNGASLDRKAIFNTYTPAKALRCPWKISETNVLEKYAEERSDLFRQYWNENSDDDIEKVAYDIGSELL